ncbi:L,D-transpeptidase family protein [Virgisporangium aurantiacum]|uniref:L,D-transpeptidase family protein n=1 Tax=Virgisporangium aurantiacum TaxID=175570 RepID=UPI00195117CC|nr:L,D-transpeptidase family protein [Virgisporangium aurantiacum]
MGSRSRHTLAAAAVSVVLVVVIAAAAWFTAGPHGGRPADAADTAATATEQTRPGAADSGTPGATTASVPASSAPASGSATARATAPGPVATPVAAQRLRKLPSATRQVVIVSTESFGSNVATLEAFTKVGDRWQVAFPPMHARIGQAGFADRKAEGDLKTPTGVYPLDGTMYGIAADPGVRYAYHRLVPDDWWNENPATPGYNTFFHGPNPGGASEALWQISPQYRYFAVINYNIPVVPADPPRGSGIFLHVANPGKATAGCVSLAETDLLAVLRWLDPGSAPRMVLAPRAVLDRY